MTDMTKASAAPDDANSDDTSHEGDDYPPMSRRAVFTTWVVLLLIIGAVSGGVILHHNREVHTAVLDYKEGHSCHHTTVVENHIKIVGPPKCTTKTVFSVYTCEGKPVDMTIDQQLLDKSLTARDASRLNGNQSLDYYYSFGEGGRFVHNTYHEYVVSYHPDWRGGSGKAFKITRFDHYVDLAKC